MVLTTEGRMIQLSNIPGFSQDTAKESNDFMLLIVDPMAQKRINRSNFHRRLALMPHFNTATIY